MAATEDRLADTPHEIRFAPLPRVIVDTAGAAVVLGVAETWVKANVKYLPHLTYAREPHFVVEDLLRWATAAEHAEPGLFFSQRERRAHREHRQVERP